MPGVAMGAGYTVIATKEGYEPASQADVEVVPARTVTVNLVLRREAGETDYAINETFDDEATGAFTATTDGVLTARTAPAAGTIDVVADAADEGNLQRLPAVRRAQLNGVRLCPSWESSPRSRQRHDTWRLRSAVRPATSAGRTT